MEKPDSKELDDVINAEVTRILETSVILRDNYDGEFTDMWASMFEHMQGQQYDAQSHGIPIGTSVHIMDTILLHNNQVLSGEIENDHFISEKLIRNWYDVIDEMHPPDAIDVMKEDLRTTKPFPFEDHQRRFSLRATIRLVRMFGDTFDIWKDQEAGDGTSASH